MLRFSRAGPEFTLEPGSAGQRIGYRLRNGAVEVLYWPHLDQPRGRRARGVCARRRHRALRRRLPRRATAAGTTAGRCSANPSVPARGARRPHARRRHDRRALDHAAMKRRAPPARDAAPPSCSRCCWRRSPRRWPRRCSPISSAGAAPSSTAATRCRRRRSRWRACSGARQILYDDAQHSAIDHLGEPWALALPPIPLDNGEVRGAIIDAQARLNVNALGAYRRERGHRTDAHRAAVRAAWRAGRQRSMRSPTGSTATAIARDGGAEDAWYAARPRGWSRGQRAGAARRRAGRGQGRDRRPRSRRWHRS